MTERKKQIAVAVLIIWLLLVIFFMILAGKINLEILFVLWLSALLVIVEFISPSYVKPPYLTHLKLLIAIGIMVFILIIVQKLVEIIKL